jgi:hypothetical protein
MQFIPQERLVTLRKLEPLLLFLHKKRQMYKIILVFNTMRRTRHENYIKL